MPLIMNWIKGIPFNTEVNKGKLKAICYITGVIFVELKLYKYSMYGLQIEHIFKLIIYFTFK